eukprot:3137191-Pleurochrysis_carterae.AAC.1
MTCYARRWRGAIGWGAGGAVCGALRRAALLLVLGGAQAAAAHQPRRARGDAACTRRVGGVPLQAQRAGGLYGGARDGGGDGGDPVGNREPR